MFTIDLQYVIGTYERFRRFGGTGGGELAPPAQGWIPDVPSSNQYIQYHSLFIRIRIVIMLMMYLQYVIGTYERFRRFVGTGGGEVAPPAHVWISDVQGSNRYV